MFQILNDQICADIHVNCEYHRIILDIPISQQYVRYLEYVCDNYQDYVTTITSDIIKPSKPSPDIMYFNGERYVWVFKQVCVSNRILYQLFDATNNEFYLADESENCLTFRYSIFQNDLKEYRDCVKKLWNKWACE